VNPQDRCIFSYYLTDNPATLYILAASFCGIEVGSPEKVYSRPILPSLVVLAPGPRHKFGKRKLGMGKEKGCSKEGRFLANQAIRSYSIFSEGQNAVIQMLSPEQKEYILQKAYVPEHIIDLMVGISDGEPFFFGDYVFYAKSDWLIFIGYPFDRHFQVKHFTATLNDTMKKFKPAYTWFIAPEMPDSFLQAARQRESDEYYKLDIRNHTVKKDLIQKIRKASGNLTVEKSHHFSPCHVTLTKEFLHRESPSPRVGELFLCMPEYVARSSNSIVLSAWDKNHNLSAFYVIELAAPDFATYVVGCFSKSHYVAHASDLLFFEMINLARENHKEYIHLGLGVNEGIRRFKKKWGGIPFLKYEFGELSARTEGALPWLRSLEAKL